jgi:tellurite resistance protein TerC
MLGDAYHWKIFSTIVLVMLTLDLFVFHRKNTEPKFSSSLLWTIFWFSLAAAFNGLIYYWAGKEKALEFATGYLVEWSLSMDNVFVFAVIFKFFRIPMKNQYRVLFWGIVGAVVMRFIFIFAGTQLLSHFDWLMAVFGTFLIYTGFKLLSHDDDDLNPEENLFLKLARKILPVSQAKDPETFFVRENGKLCVTQLFLVLIVVETSDVLFALDSVPAIFGISKDPYIIFTSNIFAILGLRALYFLIASVMGLIHYLHYGLSSVLVFIGFKMNLDYWYEKPDGGHWISPSTSLLVIIALIGLSVFASLLVKPKLDPEP